MELSSWVWRILCVSALAAIIACHDSTGNADGDSGLPDENTDSTAPESSDTGLPPDLGIEWIPIAGGTFEMGSENGTYREIPVHTVTVPGFEMMKTEVTLEQYEQCVSTGKCEQALPPWDTSLYQEWCNIGHSDRNEHPINCVNWYGADAFCAWIGAKLPTEAEWEYAARSQGQAREYPWGNEEATCDLAVMRDDDIGCNLGSTWPVCSKPLGNTDQGLCDMAGNVYEWVADEYHGDYIGAPTNGSAWISGETYRVILRGGSWGNALSEDLRSSTRNGYAPDPRDPGAGFRCARSLL
jgi:formylglycine-generating enzyme required for sulfatase activity